MQLLETDRLMMLQAMREYRSRLANSGWYAARDTDEAKADAIIRRLEDSRPTLCDRAIEMLMKYSFSHKDDDGYPECPECLGWHESGHAPDCELAAILREAEKNHG
jgi:hypothetical protein